MRIGRGCVIVTGASVFASVILGNVLVYHFLKTFTVSSYLFGVVVGLLLMAAFVAVVLAVLYFLFDWGFGNEGTRPLCENGICHHSDYSLVHEEAGEQAESVEVMYPIWVCRCGNRYVFGDRHREFLALNANGSTRVYMRYVRFRGWQRVESAIS
jgi:hypothetical protein